MIDPLTIHIPQEAIDDLHQRLGWTRLPDTIPGTGWEYGADLAYMTELLEYWRTRFDWRKEEARLNSFHHYKATVDGIGIHFIHEKGKGPNPIPLVLTHGWPGSFVEFLKLIPMLTDPARFGGDEKDSFDVVVPSLPGYGFSERPSQKGMNAFAIAGLWKDLMQSLGYSRFAAHGGDWGASVATCLGFLYPENVIGVHLNYIPGSYQPYTGPGARALSEVEKKSQSGMDEWYVLEGGYGHQQRTMPQTLAYALTDSPAGLAAWIVEKFRAWSDCDGAVEKRFTKDELLTNVSIYWFTETIHSSMRLYFEGRLRPLHFGIDDRMEVPCGVIRFAKEAPFSPREWVERFYNVRRWNEHPSGGHFAAMEEPEVLARDVRAFFKSLRRTK